VNQYFKGEALVAHNATHQAVDSVSNCQEQKQSHAVFNYKSYKELWVRQNLHLIQVGL
jgi:hypothetical protein